MAKLFFVGDSITAGAWDQKGGWVSRLTGNIMQLNIEAMDAKESFYCLPYNIGVSGDTIPDVLARIESEISVRLDSENKNEKIQIITAIGVNDSVYLIDEDRPRFTDEEFRQNLRQLIRTYQKFTSNISFVGLMPVDDEILNPIPWAPTLAYAQKYVSNYERIISEICNEINLPFFPMFERWKALQDFRKFLLDGVHPNSDGHALISEQLKPFIINDAFKKFHEGE
jgi:lysophospholipase L1-like esterase